LTQQLTPELAREHLQRLTERRNEVAEMMRHEAEMELEKKRMMARFLDRIDRIQRKESWFYVSFVNVNEYWLLRNLSLFEFIELMD
jgi:hypothetical protein